MVQAVSGNAGAIWERARADLEAGLPASSFKLWVEPVRAVSCEGSTLYLTAPDGVRDWIERRYAPRIVAALRRHAPSLSEVGFVAGGGRERADQPAARPGALGGGEFGDFVIGSANRFAHAAALAVAELPGEAYNPLFLHGPPGVGKTHLLASIAAYLRRSRPALAVLGTTAERFVSEFVAALRGGEPERFKRRYRSAGALLIDDVQFLEDKERTAEELFHTFDALHSEGGQIVLSSDRAPRELSRLTERLRDRFEWGLCAEIRPPDMPTRLAVLRRLAGGLAPAPGPGDREPVLREIAARCSNLRQLEGALTRVAAFASLMGSTPTPKLVRDVLGADAPATPPRERASVEQVQEAVCAVLHLSRDEMLSDRRTPTVVRARQLAIYMARERLSLSLAELARAFHRDRATILYSVRSVEREMRPDSPIGMALARAAEQLDLVPDGGEAAPAG